MGCTDCGIDERGFGRTGGVPTEEKHTAHERLNELVDVDAVRAERSEGQVGGQRDAEVSSDHSHGGGLLIHVMDDAGFEAGAAAHGDQRGSEFGVPPRGHPVQVSRFHQPDRIMIEPFMVAGATSLRSSTAITAAFKFRTPGVGTSG